MSITWSDVDQLFQPLSQFSSFLYDGSPATVIVRYPILAQCTISIPFDNVRKPFVF